MLVISPMLVTFFPAALFVAAQITQPLDLASPDGVFAQAELCMVVSPPCMSEADRYSLEALRTIHQMMDDDQDGGIEVEESVEFIIEDMKQQQTNKHSNLHREDQHITVEELWRGWKSSEVHNWTQDAVLRWLREFVELPQYEKNFKEFKVNGNTLPRIAANEPSFLSVHLRVQDQRDKQKLNIKALDVVLFGPPTRPPHNYTKDLLLIVSVVMGFGGCWFAQAQNKASKIHITKMMKDLESLQRAEQSLTDLQEQLERAQEEKRNVAEEKHNLEEKMRDEIMGAQEEANRLHELRRGAVSELSRLRYAEEELEQVLGALKRAEKDMHDCWTASEELQQWLQLTHEVEVQYYNVKKQSAVLQLACAKEEAERIKKKRSSVLGTLHVAHSSSLDQVDHKILQAKNALSEITACLRERLHRWQQIEQLCGFPIIRNPGLASLTAHLYSDSVSLGFPRATQPPCSCHSSIHGSIEDLLEASTPIVLPQMPVPPLKHSPRARKSTICRSRRPGIISQPSVMMSPDPDLLIPIRSSYPCLNEEEGHFLKTIKKQDSEERFSDAEYMGSPPNSKCFQCPAVSTSSQKLYHDETEHLSKEAEAVIESPVHKISIQELNAAVDVSCRKMAKDKILKDTTFESPSVKKSKDEPYIEAASRTRQRKESSTNAVVKRGLSIEVDTDFPARKIERGIIGDLMDTDSRSLHKERIDLPLDVRKTLWNEKATTDISPRKISADMMGISMDGATRKMIRDDTDHLIDSVSRRIQRDVMAMSLDTSYRKLPRNKGDCQHESSVRALVKDKMVEIAKTQSRKTSRDELEYCADSASIRVVPREKSEVLIDTTPCTDILEEEPEMSTGSLRRSMPRKPRDDSDSSTDSPKGKIPWDRVDVSLEVPKRSIQEDSRESSSSPGQTGQSDLMVTSQGPWNSSSDLYTVGPLSQLVYDGILEKSCNSISMVPTNLSASTTNFPQTRLRAKVETSPPTVTASSEFPCEGQRDKEKSKKSLKLKNLFKKKNETTPEKIQSGL